MPDPDPDPDPDPRRARRAIAAASRAATRHWVASAREESRLKIVVVAAGALGLLAGTFLLARAAFAWLADFGGAVVGTEIIATLLTAKLISLFAAALFVLLATSTIAASFASFFRSRELPLLIASPLPAPELARARTLRAIALASWASAFLAAPLVLAWGLSIDAPLGLYPVAAGLFVPFATLAGCLGTVVMLLLARLFASRPVGPLVAVGIAVVAALFVVARRVVRSFDVDSGVDLSGLLAIVSRAEHPLLPSTWLADGVLAAARGELAQTLLPAALLVSWALGALRLVEGLGGRWHPRIWGELADRGARAAGRRAPVLATRLVERLIPGSRALSQLAAKDLRTFWRDPAQWSQFAVFFGLLAVYVATMRTSALGGYDARLWRSLLTLLNSGAGLLVLATLTTRFVFPSVGVEGRRFWILGLAPLPTRALVLEKLLLALVIVTPFPIVLALVSGLRLELQPLELLLSLGVVLLSALALCGIAVGLGCLLPSFEEDDPSRIVSGFGGTLTFVASLAWVGLATALETAVLRWELVDAFLGTGWSRGAVAATVLAALAALAVVAAAIPLRLGLRRLERLEL